MSIVYFMQAVDGGPIKVGISVDPEERLRQIQTGSPVRLRIRHTEPGGRARELYFHRRWDAYRLEGEWFQPNDDMEAYLRNAPRHSAGPRFTLPSIPVLSAIAWLAVIPRGAWRILASLILYTLAPRRRRRTRPYALTGALLAAGGTALTHTNLLTPAATILAITAAAIVACTIAGATRYR